MRDLADKCCLAGKIGIGNSAPSQLLTVAGNISGSGTLNIDGAATIDGNISSTAGNIDIAATKKIFLDGGGDSYIHEVSADRVQVFVGGQALLDLSEGGGGASDYVAIKELNKFYKYLGDPNLISQLTSRKLWVALGGVFAVVF